MSVLPVGHYLGERYPEGLHYVRVGRDHQTMTDDEFGVWVLFHQDNPRVDVEAVLKLAAQADLPDAETAMERLLSAGALVKVTDEVAFAKAYRLRTLLVGLGNTPEDPDTYYVGLPGHEPAQLGAGSYELWQWSALTPSLWHTCEIRAKVANAELAPADVVPELLADLRPLLANNCGYLDPAT
ncbi:hypothetical protein [Actinophytocola sp.]|uniref:hypothetical protein n=1 Tax=Actinophytocola sp. TaxID=1872138 RepID=UPI002ED5E0BB